MEVDPLTKAVYLSDDYQVFRINPDGAVAVVVETTGSDERAREAGGPFAEVAEIRPDGGPPLEVDTIEGFALDPPRGDLYFVVDGKVLRLAEDKTITTVVGPGRPHPELTEVEPLLTFDPASQALYVHHRNRIFRVAAAGAVTVVAGDDTISYGDDRTVDGPAASTTLLGPALTTGPAGALHVGRSDAAQIVTVRPG
jgi:hypothetical protein